MVEMILKAMRNGDLNEGDMFTSAVFYYLAGLCPEKRMGECILAVNAVRDMIILRVDLEENHERY